MMVERTIGTNPVKPGRKGSPAIEPANILPGPQERLLGKIFGVVLVSGHTKCNFVDSPRMVLHQEAKGVVISLLRLFQTGVDAMIHLAVKSLDCVVPERLVAEHTENFLHCSWGRCRLVCLYTAGVDRWGSADKGI
jgi:hypothetical protein